MRDTDAAEPHDKSRKKVLEMGRLQLGEPGHRPNSLGEEVRGLCSERRSLCPDTQCAHPRGFLLAAFSSGRGFLTLGRSREKGQLPGRAREGAPGGWVPGGPLSSPPHTHTQATGSQPGPFSKIVLCYKCQGLPALEAAKVGRDELISISKRSRACLLGQGEGQGRTNVS